MRFPLNIGMCDPTHYGPMAQAAESAGYDSIAVPDSLTCRSAIGWQRCNCRAGRQVDIHGEYDAMGW